MVRNSVPAGRRRGFGALLGAGGLGVLVVATAAACASTPETSGAGGTGSAPVMVSGSAAASPSASPSRSAAPGTPRPSAPSAPSTPSAPASGGAATSPSSKPVIPFTGGIVITPQAQVSAIPAEGKLTAFDSASLSKDGMTLYLGIESMGGACGQYDVVLQQNSAKVSVGLVLLPSGGRVCPMYVAHMSVAAQLSAPLGDRSVVDLADGQVVRTPALS